MCNLNSYIYLLCSSFLPSYFNTLISTTGMTHLNNDHASQGSIQRFEYLKRKLYRCNASIYFNKQCLQKQLIPNYAKIKVPPTSPAAKFTLHKAQTLRIKDELKYLYSKKQQLNLQIYHLHILLANTWWIPWPLVSHTIEEKLRRAMKPTYDNLNQKLNKLTQSKTRTPTPPTHFFPGS